MPSEDGDQGVQDSSRSLCLRVHGAAGSGRGHRVIWSGPLCVFLLLAFLRRSHTLTVFGPEACPEVQEANERFFEEEELKERLKRAKENKARHARLQARDKQKMAQTSTDVHVRG